MRIKSKIKNWQISKFLINKQYYFKRSVILKHLPKLLIDNANNKISKWKGYKKTPLVRLNKLSKELGLGEVFYKDESKDFT